MLRNLPLLAWTKGQILEAHVGFATRSAVSGPLWKSLWLRFACENQSKQETAEELVSEQSNKSNDDIVRVTSPTKVLKMNNDGSGTSDFAICIKDVVA